MITAKDPGVQSIIPVPDPSLLTTEQLRRELQALREIVETRLDAMDQAGVLLKANITDAFVGADREVSHLRVLHAEKFESIERQFKERDVRTEQAAIATKIAVDAALQAQKEAAGAQNESNAAAITKSEAATIKQIDGIQALIRSSIDGLSGRIVELKERLDRGEGVHSGISSSLATVIAFASASAAVVAVIVVLMHGH